MTQERYVLGIDIGTSSAKVAIVNPDGKILRIHSAGYPMRSPYPGWAELDADDWWNAIVQGVRHVMEGVDPVQVAGIGFSSAGGSVVLLDEQDQLLRPIMLWLDVRAAPEGEELLQRYGADFWLERIGMLGLNFLVVAKVMWLHRHEPDVLARAATLFQTSDFVIYRMTGQRILDRSNACSGGMYNLYTREWDEDILEAVSLPAHVLPALSEPGSIAGGLLPSVAAEMGLRADTPVVMGAWDQCCVAVGAGATAEGESLLSTGTAWVLCRPSSTLRAGPEARVYTVQHAVPDQYFIMSPMSNAGSVVEWYRLDWGGGGAANGESGKRGELAGIPDGIDEISPGAGGLVFLPHLQGATAPHWDPVYSGCLLGVRAGATGAHVFRAILEAVAFEVRWNLDVLSEMGEKVDRLRMIGGATNSLVWPQIVADVTGRQVAVPRERECAVMGAARLAQKAIGLSVPATSVGAEIERSYAPDAMNAVAYDRLFPIYKRAFSELRGTLKDLSSFSKG